MIILPHLPHILAQVRLISVKPLLGCLAAPSNRLGPCLVVPHGVRAIPFANSCCDFTPFTQGPWMNHLGPTDLQHLWSITSKKHLCLLPFQPLTHRAGGNLLQGTSSTSSWVLQLLFLLPWPLISPIQGPRTVSVPLLGAARQPKRSLCSPAHRSSSAAVPAVSSSQPKARRSIPTESFHHEATKREDLQKLPSHILLTAKQNLTPPTAVHGDLPPGSGRIDTHSPAPAASL